MAVEFFKVFFKNSTAVCIFHNISNLYCSFCAVGVGIEVGRKELAVRGLEVQVLPHPTSLDKSRQVYDKFIKIELTLKVRFSSPPPS